MDKSTTVARDFERESHRIDQEIWDALALRAGESALFCGFGNDVEWIKRAKEIGVDVSVIESHEDAIRDHAHLGVKILRGSTSVIPARDNTFDAAIAFHYLHEIDPLFHANVISELARVGKRLAIVEPAPPSDPIGLRISHLYSRAKRELGAFENYQQLEYWKKLISMVKAEVTGQTLSFMRVPPREAIRGTVDLLIDTMAAEDIPQAYIDELHALANRHEAQLLPQARLVLVGVAAGAPVPSGAGTQFREGVDIDDEPVAPTPAPTRPALPRPVAARPATLHAYTAPAEPEFPPVIPPAAPAPQAPAPVTKAPTPVPANTPFPPVAAAPTASDVEPEPEFGFGLPAADATRTAPSASPAKNPAPFGAPFSLPPELLDADAPFGIPAPGAEGLEQPGFGWTWEPPESQP
jgi:ubiquinone/menaquinone biosynthesis C-methylase UbiE